MRCINYKKTYFDGKCAKCGSNDTILDDIDFRFEGCQDEYHVCKNCKRGIYVKVRYKKVCKVEYSVENACEV